MFYIFNENSGNNKKKVEIYGPDRVNAERACVAFLFSAVTRKKEH